VTPDVTLRTQVRPLRPHDPSAGPAAPTSDPEEVDFSPWDPKAWLDWCTRLVPPLALPVDVGFSPRRAS
jgi:hypothetical protein